MWLPTPLLVRHQRPLRGVCSADCSHLGPCRPPELIAAAPTVPGVELVAGRGQGRAVPARCVAILPLNRPRNHRPVGARPTRPTVPDTGTSLRVVPALFERSSDEVFASVLDGQPDIRDALDAVSQAAWASVDPVLLELCRLRMAMLFGCPAELAWRTPAAVTAGLEEERIEALAHWPTSQRFGPRERACLAFAEQFVIDVAGIDDVVAGAVVEHLGEQGLADFASALLVVEQRLRLRLTWQRLFEPAS